jgi:hypothetical protein
MTDFNPFTFFGRSIERSHFARGEPKEEALTQALARELLDYDPDTGILTWRARDCTWFDSDQDWRWWNKRYAGQRASSISKAGNHAYIKIFGRDYLAHRVIFLWMRGRWPYPQIDHSDQNRQNNLWKNLREVTHQENHKNVPLRSDNTTGHVGVYKRRNKYRAEIMVNRKQIQLGTFPTQQEAIEARVTAQRRHGYHENHGRVRT